MQTMLGHTLAIALAGALGTLARYGLSGALRSLLGAGFAWGTLAANLIGCLLIGILMQAALEGSLLPEPWRPVLVVGFCGAFTTFSTFGHETLLFMRDGSYLLALGNIAGNLVLGILCVWLGFIIMRLITGGV